MGFAIRYSYIPYGYLYYTEHMVGLSRKKYKIMCFVGNINTPLNVPLLAKRRFEKEPPGQFSNEGHSPSETTTMALIETKT